MSARLLPAVLACALCVLLSAPAAWSRCVDEGQPEPADPGAAAPAPGAAPAPADPRATLHALVQEALERSHAVGATRLLADAAESDVDEARAAKLLQAGLNGGVGPAGSHSAAQGTSLTETALVQARLGISVSQLLYDGGRTDRLVDWRSQLAESARQGSLSTREQLALSTVALALERTRYRQHVVIYGQYVRKMGCLVEALESIVRTDRGRASELVQAKKSLQQAELMQVGAQTLARQVDIRLRRLVGDGLPGTDGLSAVLLNLPELNVLVAEVEQAAEIRQLTAQAAAAGDYARAVAAGGKPQVSWSVGGGGTAAAGGNLGGTRSANYSVGLTVSIPLVNPGLAPALNSAELRARAAKLQTADAIESRRFRAADVHEQATSSFDRMRRVASVLRDSEQLRNFTLQQWQQLGRRSLFDVMATEADHYSLRVAYVNALFDGQQLNANLVSLGRGLTEWLR